jgi:hypothetical protein
MLTILPGIHSGPRADGSHLLVGTSGSRGDSPPALGYRSDRGHLFDLSGVDHVGTVGKLAPGLFAEEYRWWRMVYGSGRPGRALHGARGVGWQVEVSRWLDEGVELRAARR